MRTPQYDPLRSLLSQLLNHFLTLDPVLPVKKGGGRAGVQPEGTMATPIPETTPTYISPVATPTPLGLRKPLLDAYIGGMPRNAEDNQLLRGCGYRPRLWDQGITHCEDGQLSQFGEHEADLTGLLQRILRHPQAVEHHSCGLPYGGHVFVDGTMVKSSELFSEEQSLVELKGRRAIGVTRSWEEPKMKKSYKGDNFMLCESLCKQNTSSAQATPYIQLLNFGSGSATGGEPLKRSRSTAEVHI
ncbi:hypothetical protein EMCRGX_G014642 [Ephydatia muelleri]